MITSNFDYIVTRWLLPPTTPISDHYSIPFDRFPIITRPYTNTPERYKIEMALEMVRRQTRLPWREQIKNNRKYYQTINLELYKQTKINKATFEIYEVCNCHRFRTLKNVKYVFTFKNELCKNTVEHHISLWRYDVPWDGAKIIIWVVVKFRNTNKKYEPHQI